MREGCGGGMCVVVGANKPNTTHTGAKLRETTPESVAAEFRAAMDAAAMGRKGAFYRIAAMYRITLSCQCVVCDS